LPLSIGRMDIPLDGFPSCIEEGRGARNRTLEASRR
jgi:hypothetical protein